jgi:hypothetical protein
LRLVSRRPGLSKWFEQALEAGVVLLGRKSPEALSESLAFLSLALLEALDQATHCHECICLSGAILEHLVGE